MSLVSIYHELLLICSHLLFAGVYTRSLNATLLFSHSVKLIGWGVEQGVDYWLLVNSWGSSWGDNGLFKFRRGTDECLLESNIVAGVPDAASF